LPQFDIIKDTKIMNLTNGTLKMSKSDLFDRSRINLTDSV